MGCVASFKTEVWSNILTNALRCRLYIQSYWIIRTWNNFDLDCWIYHKYEWRQFNALLQLYKYVRWSLDRYILVHWLAPGVRLGLVSLPRIPTLLATDTLALLVDQAVQTKQLTSLMDTKIACDPTCWPANQLTIKDTNNAYDGHTGATCGPSSTESDQVVQSKSCGYQLCLKPYLWTSQPTNHQRYQHCLRRTHWPYL